MQGLALQHAKLNTIGAVLVVVSCCTAGLGQTQSPPGMPGFGAPQRDADLVTLTVVTDNDRLEPAKQFNVVFIFQAKENWHLYWKNPAAGAAPIDVKVTAPGGFVVHPARWPRPEVFKSDVGDMYGYAGQFALFVPVTVPADFNAGAVMLQYELSWAVCDENRCVLQRRNGSLALSSGMDRDERDVALIRRLRQRLPIDIDDADDVNAAFEDGTLTITGPAHGEDSVHLLVNPSPGVTFATPQTSVSDGRFRVIVRVSTEPRNFAGTKPTAGGLIGLGQEPTDPSYEFSIPLSR